MGFALPTAGRRGAVAVAFAVTLTACGTTGAPVPSGYRAAACGALTHLQAADAQLVRTGAAVEESDPDQVALGATAMQREAEAATDALAAAPPWEPGARMAESLSAAASGYRRAAQLFRRGARQENGPAIDDAVAAAREAAGALTDAVAAEAGLRFAPGWERC